MFTRILMMVIFLWRNREKQLVVVKHFPTGSFTLVPVFVDLVEAEEPTNCYD